MPVSAEVDEGTATWPTWGDTRPRQGQREDRGLLLYHSRIYCGMPSRSHLVSGPTSSEDTRLTEMVLVPVADMR